MRLARRSCSDEGLNMRTGGAASPTSSVGPDQVAADTWKHYYQGRRVLILGAAGFIGRHLSAALLTCGAYLTLSATTVRSFSAMLSQSDQVTHVICDVRDGVSVRAAVMEQEVVFNLAGRSGSVGSVLQPELDAHVNLLGALAVLEAVRLYSPSTKIVFPSSRLVYGRTDRLPVSEETPLMPTTPYGVHKLAAELHHLNYGHLLGLRTTALRISIPFGAHLYVSARDYGVANRFVQLAVQDQPLPIYSPGCQLRDYVYVDDLVSALGLVGATEVSDGRVYNVGSGEGVALADFARLVVAEAGRGRLEFRDWPEISLAVETGDFVADINRIRSELGWAPRVSLREGVQRTIRHVQCALTSRSGTTSSA